jgi:predicted AAA+ superfamily ATPase
LNDILGNPILGFSWEGYVIEQIISCAGDSYDYYFYRTQDGTEADLLMVQGNKPEYTIEIKYTSTPKLSKGFSTAIMDLGTIDNYILVPEVRQSYSLSDKVKVIDLDGFLNLIGVH